MKNKRGFKLGVVSAALLIPCAGLQAGSMSAPFQVSVEIVDACTEFSASPISFGQVVSLTFNQTTTGTITANCASGSQAFIDLDAGLHPPGAEPWLQRGMEEPVTGQRYYYNLYSDSNHSTVWGLAMSGGGEVMITGTGAPQDLTVYAKITQGSNVPGGIYSDTVTASISF